MTIHFSFTVILLLIGILTGLLSAATLLSAHANRQANRYLVALLLVSTGSLFHNFLLEANIYNQYPQLYFLPVLLSFGIGPLLYLYINRLINLHPLKRRIVLFHLLPVIMQFLFYLFCFLQDTENKYDIYTRLYQPFINPIQNLAVYFSMAFYIYLSFKEIHFFKRQLNYYYSNSDKIALQWLNRLLYMFMIYYILSVLFAMLSYSFNISANYFPSDFTRCLIIFTIAIFAVKQNSLVSIQDNLHSIAAEPILPEENSNSHSISAQFTGNAKNIEETTKTKEVNAELLKKIVAVVENEKLYLQEDLTIADLAAKIGYSSKTISFSINSGLKKSFSLFINEYRVNLFREKKASGKFDHLTIMSLAYDCGFNSKSTFNRIYKEITGASPKEQKPVGKEVPNPELSGSNDS